MDNVTTMNSSLLETKETQPAWINTVVLIWTIFLLIFGIPGNLLSAFIMGSDRNNRLTTRIMMIMLAICDTIVLIVQIFFRYFLQSAFNIFLRKQDIYCRIIGQTGSFFTDLSSMVLCGIAIERFIMVTFPHTANQIVTMKNSGIALLLLISLLVIKNGFLLFLIKFDAKIPQCSPSAGIWMNLDFVCFAILPYLILFTCNIYIFILLRRSRRAIKSKQNSGFTGEQNLRKKEFLERVKANEAKTLVHQNHNPNQEKQTNEIHRKRKTENIVKILLGLTLIHYIFTLPATLSQINNGDKNIAIILKMVLYTNYASNFFVYTITSKLFRHKMREIFLKMTGLCHLKMSTSESGRSSFSTSIGRRSNLSRSVIFSDKLHPIVKATNHPNDGNPEASKTQHPPPE